MRPDAGIVLAALTATVAADRQTVGTMCVTEDQPKGQHDVLAVLTRAGAARDAFHDELHGTEEVDAGLVAAVLADGGRVTATLDTRRTLIALASLLRSLDAWQCGRIELEELAAGCAVHAAATDRFASFGAVRADLRTADELLQLAVAGRLGSAVALRAQLELIDGSLRDWFAQELYGRVPAVDVARVAVAEPDERTSVRVRDRTRIAQLDRWSRELVQEDADAPFFSGLAGSCWQNGWIAVPVPGDQLGDDADEVRRFAGAASTVGAVSILQIDRTPQPQWRVHGPVVVVVEPLRAVYEFEPNVDAVRRATAAQRFSSIITEPDLSFAVVERDDHHVVAGNRTFIECYLDGRSFAEAWADFRDHVERTYADDEPPEHLLDAARDYPRASRRGLGATR